MYNSQYPCMIVNIVYQGIVIIFLSQDPGTPLSIPGMLPPINTNRMPPTGLGGTGSSPLASPVTTPSGQLSPSLAGGNESTGDNSYYNTCMHVHVCMSIVDVGGEGVGRGGGKAKV